MKWFKNYLILVISAFWCFYVAAQSEFETKLNELLDEGNITAE